MDQPRAVEMTQILERRLAASFGCISAGLECQPRLTDPKGNFVVKAKIYGADKRRETLRPVLRCEGSAKFGEIPLKQVNSAEFEYEVYVPAAPISRGESRLVLHPSPEEAPIAVCTVWVVKKSVIKAVEKEIMTLALPRNRKTKRKAKE